MQHVAQNFDWALPVIRLLGQRGAILDVACGNGVFLEALGGNFQLHGLEDHARAIAEARAKGIAVLGPNLFASIVQRDHVASFDVLVALDVFQSPEDMWRGIESSITLLKSNGFFLFSFSLSSLNSQNNTFESSIRYLVRDRLSCGLVDFETSSGDSRTYVGIVTRDDETLARAVHFFGYFSAEEGLSPSAVKQRAEDCIRAKQLVSAMSDVIKEGVEANDLAPTVAAQIAGIVEEDALNSNLTLRQHVMSWEQKHHGKQADKGDGLRLYDEAINELRLQVALATDAYLRASERLKSLGVRESELTAELDCLKVYAIEPSEAARVIEELTSALELTRADARMNNAQAARTAAFASQSQLALETRTAAAERRTQELEQRLRAISASALGRIFMSAYRTAERHPRLTRRIRQIAKLAYWTIKLQLFSRLRTARAQRIEAAQLSTIGWLSDARESSDSIEPLEIQPWPASLPLVSVVIPCFNYGHLVEEAIASVRAQTLGDIEIIVVEGGSTSLESRMRLATIAETAPGNVRVLLQDQARRAGQNRNFGIAHARGKYICCLDADDCLAPTYLEKAVFLLEQYAYDVVSTALRTFGERADIWTPVEKPNLQRLLEINDVVTCAVFRRSLWEQAGGYRDSDPKSGHVHEDWVFWVRLAALGARFFNIRGEQLFLYRIHGATLSNRANVLGMDVQRERVRLANTDVLTSAALEPARRNAARHYRVSNALVNLARRSRHEEGPVLLLATGHLILGGAERLLSSIVAHLVACGWRVIIVTTVAVDAMHGDTTPWFESSTHAIYHLPRFLSEERWRDFVDYLIAAYGVNVLWVVGSVFFYEQLPSLEHAWPRVKVADLLFNVVGHTANNRKYAPHIDLHLVENQEVKQWLLATGELPESIKLIQSGVDIVKYQPGPKNGDLMAERGIPSDALIVGYSGRWSEEKDPVGFVEIAKRVPKDLRVCFIMTGRGPLEVEVQRAIASANFPAGRFIVCGEVESLTPYLRIYDTLVLPSRLDGRPNIVMEALASGTPVIASRVGALPEMIQDSTCGYLCEPGNYQEFADKLAFFSENAATLIEFKKNARDLAVSQYDISTMLTQYEDELYRLVPKKPLGKIS